MFINKRLAHSMIWSTLLATSTLTACKTKGDQSTDEKQTNDKKQATDKTLSVDAAKTEKTENPEEPVAVVVEEQVTVVDEQQAQALVMDARAVATAMDAATAALAAADAGKAKVELDKALDALAKIEADQPNVEIVIGLWRAHRDLGIAETAAAVDTIPLLASVSRVDVPVYDRAAIKAQHTQREGQAPDSVDKADKLSDLRIIDSNLVYFETDLPIAATKLAVLEAQHLLERGQPAEAKAAIMRGIESIGVVDVVTQAPEFQARKLVWAAERKFSRGDSVDAEQLVAQARELLTPLAAHDDDPQGKLMVAALLAELEPLQAALGDPAEHPHGFRRISYDALNLARRATLRVKLLREHEQQRMMLVDALTLLERANNERGSQAKGRAILDDLDKAAQTLADARDTAAASVKPKLEDLHARVMHVHELEQATPRDDKLIGAELAALTFELRMLMLDLMMQPSAPSTRVTLG